MGTLITGWLQFDAPIWRSIFGPTICTAEGHAVGGYGGPWVSTCHRGTGPGVATPVICVYLLPKCDFHAYSKSILNRSLTKLS